MPDPNRILELFLRVLFDWDTPETDALWKTIVSISPNPKEPARPFTPNVAAGRMEDVLRCIGARRNRRYTNNYICMSTARNIREGEYTNDGFPRIARKADNAVTIKSLYVDVDVGKSGTYQTTADAELGLRKFLTDASMPDPTMQVYTGSGGFHVYWCFDRPMPIEEWRPLAEALKACAKQHGFLIDAMVTADPVRIMRLPTTFNHKGAQPVECILNMSSSFTLYRKVQLEQALAKFISAKPHTASTSGPSVKGPAQPLSGTAQNFTAGVGESAKPVPIDDVAAVCPTTADLLARAGAGVSDPLWKLSLLLATFTTDPKDAAHRMSSGWAEGGKTYDPAETDKALQDKLDARARNPKLGWPSCAQFHALHAACNTCPFLAQNKYPFSFVAKGPQPATPKTANDPLMPEGYWRNVNDHVFTQTEKLGQVDVLGYPVLDGGINTDNNQLAVKSATGGRPFWGEIDLSQQTPAKCAEAWTRGTSNRVVVRSANHTLLRDFTVSWVHHLQTKRIEQKVESFGWHGHDFIFGGTRYTPNGEQTAYVSSKITQVFKASGELQPWLDALQLVQGNQPLEVMVLTAFAAPLVSLGFSTSAVLSLYSERSGRGKTTALRLATAVWGDPTIGAAGLRDTKASVNKKLGDLRHLPVYWDEIKTDEQIDRMVDIVFDVSGNKSTARLRADASEAPVATFTTFFAVASNTSLSEIIARATTNTDAGTVRVFEIEAEQDVGNDLSITRGEELMNPIYHGANYGNAGAVYAGYLVQHRAECVKIVKDISNTLERHYRFEKPERIWLGAMATIIAAARIANDAGLVNFDVKQVASYVSEKFEQIRAEQKTIVAASAALTSPEDILGELQASTRGKNLLMTNLVPTVRMGRPLPGAITAEFFDPARSMEIWAQYGVKDGRYLLRRNAFAAWLAERRFSEKSVVRLLERHGYTVVYRKATIGSGVISLEGLAKHQVYCFDITPPKPKASKDAT